MPAVKDLQFCHHSGYRDCFACKDCKCLLLSDTSFYDGPCPFYKNIQDIRRQEHANKDKQKLRSIA